MRLILCSGVIIALVAGFFPIGRVAELVNLGTLGAFIRIRAPLRDRREDVRALVGFDRYIASSIVDE